VNRPGQYELTGSRDLPELMELAGGYSPVATHARPITLVRRDDAGRSVRSSIPESGGSSLQSGDSLDVPTIAELQKTVLIAGAVQGATGEDPNGLKRLPFAEGDTIAALIRRAGGLLPAADLRHAALTHTDGSSEAVDLEALLVARDDRADRPVASGDTLIVPAQRRTVLVEGAVFRPGAYLYNPRYSPADYVGNAGGLTRFARSIEDLKITTSDGQARTANGILRVSPGDTVVVPERDFSRAEIVQIFLGAAGILLSGAALFATLHR
jgi:protein involved in polysaccharide export with SLBB domain